MGCRSRFVTKKERAELIMSPPSIMGHYFLKRDREKNNGHFVVGSQPAEYNFNISGKVKAHSTKSYKELGVTVTEVWHGHCRMRH